MMYKIIISAGFAFSLLASIERMPKLWSETKDGLALFSPSFICLAVFAGLLYKDIRDN